MAGIQLGLIGSFPTPVTSSFESIATSTPSNGTTSITFSSIPQIYSALQIRSIVRDTSIGALDTVPIDVRLNGDATTNYSINSVRGNGTTVTVDTYNTQPQGLPWGAAVRSGSSNTTIYGAMILDIFDYTSTSRYKQWMMFSGGEINQAGGVISLDQAIWLSTAAVTSITLKADYTAFASGTTFALYGVK